MDDVTARTVKIRRDLIKENKKKLIRFALGYEKASAIIVLLITDWSVNVEKKINQTHSKPTRIEMFHMTI